MPFPRLANFLRLITLALTCCTTAALAQSPVFYNPLLLTAPDPWVLQHDGWYYYMNTTGANLTVWKTRDITDLAHAEKKVVWTPPHSGPYSRDIWAPEIHLINGHWFIYFAADNGQNRNHRIYVIENDSSDPLTGDWKFRGKVADATDRWAIDPTILDDKGTHYLIWAGWPGDANGTQNIYIAHLKNPWTIDGPRAMLSTPQYPWEEVGDLDPNGISPLPHVNVNEGPEILQHDGRIFLTYSASGCWTNYYELGMLSLTPSADPMDPHSWTKSPRPVFWQNPEAAAYGPGHNGFFLSPDGKQNWIIYHANPGPNEGCGNMRSVRIQPFTWNSDGTPDFGRPVAIGKLLPKPSGTQ